MSRKIKLGIIGIGNMGSSHAKNILNGKCPDFELAAVSPAWAASRITAIPNMRLNACGGGFM